LHKFGLTLKGGSARGLGSIGVIRFLQEENLKPLVIAGSSSGGIIASLYALGYKWEEMLELVSMIKITKLFDIRSFLTQGSLTSHKKIKQLFLKYSSDINIEDLPIKLILFATDLDKKQRIYIEKGSLIDGLIASCAYPIIIPNMIINHAKIVDGDLSSTFSTSKLKSLGAERVIGVGYKTKRMKITNTIPSKIMDIYRLLMSQVEQMSDSSNPVDVEIRYNAGDIGYFNFSKTKNLSERAYRNTLKIKAEIYESLLI